MRLESIKGLATATVAAPGGVAPGTGTVTFFDGATVVGSWTVPAGGVAT